jgi:hypothetical protein
VVRPQSSRLKMRTSACTGWSIVGFDAHCRYGVPVSWNYLRSRGEITAVPASVEQKGKGEWASLAEVEIGAMCCASQLP